MPTANLRSPAARAMPLMVADPVAFEAEFNTRSFRFDHTLSGNPLFSRARLAQLAETLVADPTGRPVRWQSAGIRGDAAQTMALRDKINSVKSAITDIATPSTWVLLHSIQRDPTYRAIVDQLMAEILDLSDLPADQVSWQDAYLCLAAPGSLTPYRIDHEATFLLQVQGTQTVNTWDARDRSVLQEEEVEAYYAGQIPAATYRTETLHKANVYALDAGTGLHQPARAPHWVRTGDTFSIALGLRFCLRDVDRQAAAYQVNHVLRRFGLRPTPPGQSGWRDAAKSALINTFAKRSPATRSEMLRSGYTRMTAPLRRS